MIPASTLYEAVIKNPGKGKPTEVTYPVVAWDDAGHALIADTSAGKLVRASEDPNFGGLRPADVETGVDLLEIEELLQADIDPFLGRLAGFEDDDGSP